MKNKRKLVELVNEVPEFPKLLNKIESVFMEEIGDYLLVLNGTNYPDAVELLEVLVPDMLLLNLNMTRDDAIKMVNRYMDASPVQRLGIITGDAGIFYMSLCSTLSSHYIIDKSLHLSSAAAAISKQQLN